MHQFARNQSEQNIQNICAVTMTNSQLVSRKSTESYITGRMFHNNREAMFNMLKIRWSTLPSQCGYSHLRRDTYSSEKYSLFRSSNHYAYATVVLSLLLQFSVDRL
ncbi:hypothetical protein COOONC_06422 [Cooperia oncophora]